MVDGDDRVRFDNGCSPVAAGTSEAASETICFFGDVLPRIIKDFRAPRTATQDHVVSLMDLETDPNELTNLWDAPDWQGVKSEIKGALLDWLARSNYMNSGYKQSRSRTTIPLWPERDGHVLHKAAAKKK
jgi:hypothetical protein